MKSETRSLVEEIIGLLWGILGIMAWNNGWKLLFYLCSFQFVVSMLAGIVYGIKYKLEKKLLELDTK